MTPYRNWPRATSAPRFDSRAYRVEVWRGDVWQCVESFWHPADAHGHARALSARSTTRVVHNREAALPWQPLSV